LFRGPTSPLRGSCWLLRGSHLRLRPARLAPGPTGPGSAQMNSV